MRGFQISARDARRGTFASQHPGGDRLAVRQHLIRAEGCSPAQTKSARSPGASEIPCPYPSSQSAGRAGGDQSRSMMSQRAQSASIMQLTLPDGEMKPVSWCTTRSPGAGPVNLSGCTAGSDTAVCGSIEDVLPA